LNGKRCSLCSRGSGHGRGEGAGAGQAFACHGQSLDAMRDQILAWSAALAPPRKAAG
jgi:hypothetical protein